MKNNNKVALITGASRGIGRAIAENLAKDGFYVVINYRSNDELAKEVLTKIEENGGKEFTVIPCLNDREDWVKTLSRWIDEWAKQEVEAVK